MAHTRADQRAAHPMRVAAPSVVAEEKDRKAPLYLGVAETQDFSPVPVQKGFVPIMKATPTAQKDTHVLVQADLNVRNDSDSPVTITYRAMLDGHHVHPLMFTVTVAPATWDLSHVQIQCNAIPAGQHTIELQAEVAGASTGSDAGVVTFGSRSMLVVQFGPIFNPPG